MNSTSYSLLKRIFSQFFKHRKNVDLNILSDLIQSELDDLEIYRILGIDLKDEGQIRQVLTKTYYRQYLRLSCETDSRKALLVVIHSMNLSQRMQSQILKVVAYPGLLFFLSLVMIIFVNFFLLPMFQNMLLFLGPTMNLSLYQNTFGLFIFSDVLIILCILCILVLVKSNPYLIFSKLKAIKLQNFWSRLLTQQFCDKFLYFYQLGGSINDILRQIQLSSSIVLSYLCFQVLLNLENGNDLAKSISIINTDLESYFRMNEEGIEITKYLQHYASIQEMILMDLIKKYGRTLLAYSYIKITFMIIVLYQVMLKPIEMMEKLL